MILFPAIDLKDGVCVRLEQGDMARATIFNRDPAAQAHTFEEEGFEHLHIVDLDGAFAGKPMNAAAVDHILETVGLCVQLGGGIRDMATIEAWLDKGVNRVIIGTAAVRDPALVKEAAREFPKRVAVGLDARDGKVAVRRLGRELRAQRARDRQAFRGRRRRRHHLHRHRARRPAQGAQSRRHDRARRGGLDPGDRLRRARLDRGREAAAGAARRQARRRDRGQGALRRAARCGRGAADDAGRAGGVRKWVRRTAEVMSGFGRRRMDRHGGDFSTK